MRIRNLAALLLAWIMINSCLFAAAEADAWTCRDCGTVNTANFCTLCGAKRPEEILCPGCGASYPSDTDAVFCGECGTKLKQDPVMDQNSPAKYEGDGFDTPEDAALCYLAGIRNLDFDQILSAFAWETQADRFDYKAMITRAKGTDPTYIPGMPVCSNLSLTANTELIRDSSIIYICRALELYINDEITQSATYALSFKEENEFMEYLQRCDNGRLEKLSEMKNIRFYTPDDATDGKFSIGRNPENFLKMTAQYGADEVVNLFITMDIGNETYVIAPSVARYGGRWYVVSIGSMISNILGIEANRQAFFPLPENVKSCLNRVSPVSEVTDLPDPGNKTRYEEKGFSTPEDAVNCYFEGLKNGDVRQMLQAFAWETLAGRYSLKDYVLDFTSAVMFSSPVRMQLDHPFMTEMNLGSWRYYQFRKIYYAIRSYILEDEAAAADLLKGYRIDLREEEEIDAFIRAFDNDRAEKLADLKNIRLMDPAAVSERYNTDQVRKRLETYKRIYGADEIIETLAVAELDGETLAFDPILVRYGDQWYIASLEGIAFSVLGIDAASQALLHIKAPAESLLSLLQ